MAVVCLPLRGAFCSVFNFVFYFHSIRRRFRVRGILIFIPIDFLVMVVISRFGLDEK